MTKTRTCLSAIGLIISLAFEHNAEAQTAITFAGIQWYVRNDSGSPGPNAWSSSDSSVWVDSLGQLHMRIRKDGDNWYCSEIYALQSFGYGRYTFYVSSNVENYDQNMVVGLFLYQNDSQEVDIEFSKWGNPLNEDGWYTVQPPPYNSSNRNNFPLNLHGDYSTHQINWENSGVFFQSYDGHYPNVPSSDYLINQWNYTGSNLPSEGSERLHINFWLNGGSPPDNQQDAELIITAVYVPLAAPVGNPATNVTDTSFTAHWIGTSGATGYRLDVSAESDFTRYVPGYENLDVGGIR